MQQSFNDDDFQPMRVRREAELTLGAGVLSLLALFLVLICGFCLWLGYHIGHGSAQAAAAPVAAAPAQKGDSSRIKPSATPSSPVSRQTPTPQSVTADIQPDAVRDPSTSSEPLYTPAPTPHPALPVQPPQPSTNPVVQIAAVSHQEDAEVLVTALRKRGYAVTVSPDPSDNLLHVRIGPFGSRAEANQWKQRLLNDGYNAIVQP